LVLRYTRALEKGFEMAWSRYLSSKAPSHITISENIKNNRIRLSAHFVDDLKPTYANKKKRKQLCGKGKLCPQKKRGLKSARYDIIGDL
jgi:hypothetical protein